MHADRYLKLVLTIIAVELGWLAITQATHPVSAQMTATPTPVVITGIDIRDRRGFLPVGVMGAYAQIPAGVALGQQRVTIDADRVLRVDIGSTPVDVRTIAPVTIEPGTRPVRVESVPATPTQRPGL